MKTKKETKKKEIKKEVKTYTLDEIEALKPEVLRELGLRQTGNGEFVMWYDVVEYDELKREMRRLRSLKIDDNARLSHIIDKLDAYYKALNRTKLMEERAQQVLRSNIK